MLTANLEQAAQYLKVPPHSIAAEQSVLGGLLLDNQAWLEVADRLTERDFYRRDHQLLFQAIKALAEDHKPYDVITVSDWFEQRNQLESVGGLAYMGTLAKNTPSAANIATYADIVREYSVLRQLMRVGTDISNDAFNPEGRPVAELLDQAERRVFEIAEQLSRNQTGFVAIKQLLTKAVDRIDMLFHQEGIITGVPTGFTDFDNKTSGLQPGDLIIIAGRPSMGKTTFALNIAENIAVYEKKLVAVFSMEMPGEQLALRMISSLGRIDHHNLRTGKLEDEHWTKLTAAISQISEAQMFIDDSPALSPTEVRARARRLVREHGPLGLIVIDYLQLMQVPGNKENRATEVAEISRALKGLAKELHVPLIALSQLNRSLEQRPDKRPKMADLRECVTGETLVVLADGSRVPICQLVGQTPSLMSVSADGHLETAASDLVWAVGKKRILCLRLASGRTLRCTGKHRLRALWGWKRADALQLGDRIALARCLPEPAQAQTWPAHEIVLLAHLLGDGSYIKHQPLRYTTANEENSRAVTQAAQAFGATVKRHAGRGNWHQLVISGNGNRWHPQGVGKWLENLGIFGQRSREKQVPAGIFQLTNPQLALFLRHLWATDGSIFTGAGKPRIHFSSASEPLARDVAALLLRFGIVARLQHVSTAGSLVWFVVDVSGAEQQRRFLDEIGAFGPRAEPAARLRTRLAHTAANTNVDTLPEEIFAYVREQMRIKGISHRRMAELRGTAYGGNAHFNFAPSRNTLLDYAEILDNDTLRRLAGNDLFWDRVVAIEPAGEAEVFDLTVPGNACWLADGIVSHNSGGIEQDADVITFIYRDEVYNPESEEKGSAEIIIAKQRNGPIGMVRLAFLGQYTRFENYAGEYYSEE